MIGVGKWSLFTVNPLESWGETRPSRPVNLQSVETCKHSEGVWIISRALNVEHRPFVMLFGTFSFVISARHKTCFGNYKPISNSELELYVFVFLLKPISNLLTTKKLTSFDLRIIQLLVEVIKTCVYVPSCYLWVCLLLNVNAKYF